VSRARMTKWLLVYGAAAFISSAALQDAEVMGETAAPAFELLGDNEMPNAIVDNLIDIAGDVAAFLVRMVPGI
jgi:hypothetical protein